MIPSQCKLAIAKAIMNSGGWPTGAKFAAQSGDSLCIGFCKLMPERVGRRWSTTASSMVSVSIYHELINGWHQTIISDDEYYQFLRDAGMAVW